MNLEVLLLCAQVFFCRICDVTLGTVRTIQVVRGNRPLAALFGFAESFLWFTIIRTALTSDLGSVALAFAYAGGFASGTFTGVFVTDKFIKSNICVQIVLSSCNDALVKEIRAAGYGVSVVPVMGSEYGPEKYMLFVEIKNSQQNDLRKQVISKDPKAFMSVQETKAVYNGYFR